MTMVKMKTFPSWALFCFKQLSEMADPFYSPEICALVAEDAILLHPEKTENGYLGLLIACESASNEQREFTDDKGNKISLAVPYVHTKVVAEEDITLYP